MWYRRHVGRRPVPDRRHLVADRDRRHPHHPAARDHRHQAGGGHGGPSRASASTWSTTTGSSVGNGEGGYLVDHRPVARDAAGHLGRPASATAETYWSRFPGRYFAGDGAKKRRGRRPVAAGPGRRRHEHLGPPDLDHRDRARPGRPPRGGRGGRGGGLRPDHRPGHRGLRHGQGRR